MTMIPRGKIKLTYNTKEVSNEIKYTLSVIENNFLISPYLLERYEQTTSKICFIHNLLSLIVKKVNYKE